MADYVDEKQVGEHHTSDHTETIEHVKQVNAAIARTDSYLDEQHVPLGWRSWLVVLITLFGFVDHILSRLAATNIDQ